MTSAQKSGTFTLGGEIEVNRMGFGAMRITGEGIWGPPPDPEASRALLRRVVNLDVDLIDTADAYGPYISEELIREALHPYEGIIVGTKAGSIRTGPMAGIRNCRPEYLKQACDGSLKRLGVDRIDLYQLHFPDPEVPYEESIGALRELRDEGKIRFVGVSNVNAEQLATARSIVDIATVQNRFSLTDRTSDDVLKECEQSGIGFMPHSPLGQGKLVEPGSPIAQAAKRHGVTTSQVALAWLLAHSPVMLPIPGTASPAHLDENVAAASLRLDDDDLAAIEALAT